MKLFTAILLLLVISGCGTVRVTNEKNLQGMAVALVKHELASETTYLRQNSRYAYYISVADEDLTTSAIADLSGSGLTIHPGSAWSDGKGMRMHIATPTLRPDGNFDVFHSYSCGIRCSSLHKAVMTHKKDGWTVVSSVMKLISVVPGPRPLWAART